MKQAKKSSLKQKLAVTLSVVNALNVCAPMALPYVNVTRNLSATGGQAVPSGGGADPVDTLIFAAQKALQPSVAYAEEVNPTTVTSNTSGNPVSVPDYQSANVTLVDGGIMSVINGGTATSTTISKGGTQIVNEGGKATSTTIYGGGTLDVNGGITENATQNGGTMIVTVGEAVSTTVNAGTMNVKNGGKANNVTLAGGTIELATGAIASGTLQGHGTATHEGGTLHVGGTGKFGPLIVTGGTLKTPNAVNVSSSGSITVNAGGTFQAEHGVTISNSGSLTVNNGGLFSAASLDATNSGIFSLSGGTLAATGDISLPSLTAAAGTVSAGGTLSLTGASQSGAALHLAAKESIKTTGKIEATTISAGTDISAGGQEISAAHISAGGTITAKAISAGDLYATTVALPNSGGTLSVSGRSVVESITGKLGAVTLNGGSMAFGGTATAPVSVGTLTATGTAAVRLGLGDGTGASAIGKSLIIDKLDGSADFYVNTDLKENQSDQIIITSAANATRPNTIRINYDPTLATGVGVESTDTPVASVTNKDASFAGFVGAVNAVGGYLFLPTVETEDGTIWKITKAEYVGPDERTHNAVMGAEVGMAALAAGNDFVGEAMGGLAAASNVGTDGVSAFANMGGGAVRQETGSHIDVKTWNAILALGHQNKKERGVFEYGAFFEYGNGNYTTHNGDERGDGSTRYTGGGLLAKWTAKHGFYVEGSLRGGNIHDDARNVLRDIATNAPYSYETDASYFGGHIGVGKEIPLTGGNTLDVYAKYFVNRKDGVSFNAGIDHYDLDAVTSQVLRLGARYTVKREQWNFYGGLAYEYEMDGKAGGRVSAGAFSSDIRAAEIDGGSVRAELGATMQPEATSPWRLDLNLAGFAGKKQGFSGGASVTLMF